MKTFEEFQSYGWFIVSNMGIDLGKRIFSSKKEAEAFKLKFKHVLSIRNGKIIEGSIDKNGFVTPNI